MSKKKNKNKKGNIKPTKEKLNNVFNNPNGDYDCGKKNIYFLYNPREISYSLKIGGTDKDIDAQIKRYSTQTPDIKSVGDKRVYPSNLLSEWLVKILFKEYHDRGEKYNLTDEIKERVRILDKFLSDESYNFDNEFKEDEVLELNRRKTLDYNRFWYLSTNRTFTENDITNLKKNFYDKFKEHLSLSSEDFPIRVIKYRGLFFIVDGQKQFILKKREKLPIVYTIEKIADSLEDANEHIIFFILQSEMQKSWKADELIYSLAKMGNYTHKQLVSIMKELGLTRSILNELIPSLPKKPSDLIKYNNIPKKEQEEFKKNVMFFHSLKEYIPTFWNSANWICGCMMAKKELEKKGMKDFFNSLKFTLENFSSLENISPDKLEFTDSHAKGYIRDEIIKILTHSY